MAECPPFGNSLAAGRFFSRDVRTDDSLAFIINETAARKIAGLRAGIGKGFSYGGVKGKLIGIVNDFHFESLHQQITPIVFIVDDYANRNLSVKIDGANFQQGLV